MNPSIDQNKRHTKSSSPHSNEQLATTFEEVADLLEGQGANEFRVIDHRPRRRAGDTGLVLIPENDSSTM